MLSSETILSLDGLEVADIACRHERGDGSPEETAYHAVGFVRRGCFVRSSEGDQTLLDPSAVFFVNPGAEQRYDHPHDGGDDCTAFLFDPTLLASLWGGDPTLPSKPVHVPCSVDTEHRLLVSHARRGGDPQETFERALEVVATALAASDRQRADSGEPRTAPRQRMLAEAARESLAADATQTLTALARSLAVSPHHLSRIFRRATGYTVSRYRLRLSTRMALERLAQGERNLARLAADLGFADQSHLCRVIRSETGETPSALRAALRTPDAPGVDGATAGGDSASSSTLPVTVARQT